MTFARDEPDSHNGAPIEDQAASAVADRGRLVTSLDPAQESLRARLDALRAAEDGSARPILRGRR